MSRIFVHGIGCVSPAGWGCGPLREALERGAPLPATSAKRPGARRHPSFRPVPPPPTKLPFLAHPRLRRTSPVTIYAAAAASEALSQRKGGRLGIVFCMTGGCVQFSRRFYDETWRDPATASPLVFPETVFNAPSSHLSALFESTSVNYTYVGDPSTMLQGAATAADWLAAGRVDECLVVGAEESDWLTSDAFGHFSRDTICGEGAGAILLSTSPSPVELSAITGAKLYLTEAERARATQAVRDELRQDGAGVLLVDSQTGARPRDAAEAAAWEGWEGARSSPKKILGEGLAAGAAWQCVAAIDALRRAACATALVSVAGTHEHAIGARFIATPLEK